MIIIFNAVPKKWRKIVTNNGQYFDNKVSNVERNNGSSMVANYIEFSKNIALKMEKCKGYDAMSTIMFE